VNFGANGFLEKPVGPGKLLSFVAERLAEQELEIKQYEETINDILRSEPRKA
jgi:FixJ family two-component response regulator